MCAKNIITTDWMGFEAGDPFTSGVDHPLPRRTQAVRWLGLQVLQGVALNQVTLKQGGITRLRIDASSAHPEEVLVPITDGGEGWTLQASTGGAVLVTYYRDVPR